MGRATVDEMLRIVAVRVAACQKQYPNHADVIVEAADEAVAEFFHPIRSAEIDSEEFSSVLGRFLEHELAAARDWESRNAAVWSFANLFLVRQVALFVRTSTGKDPLAAYAELKMHMEIRYSDLEQGFRNADELMGSVIEINKDPGWQDRLRANIEREQREDSRRELRKAWQGLSMSMQGCFSSLLGLAFLIALIGLAFKLK